MLPDASSAGLSLTGYLVGRCGVVDFYTMRYELLSVLGAVGLAALVSAGRTLAPLLVAWTACCAAIFVISVAGHARLIAEYATQPAGRAETGSDPRPRRARHPLRLRRLLDRVLRQLHDPRADRRRGRRRSLA